MKPQFFGEVVIKKIQDTIESFSAEIAYPNADLQKLNKYKNWLKPYFYNYKNKLIELSFHSYLIQTPYHNILVDTCIGNDKTFGGILKQWSNRQGPFLNNLSRLNIKPEQIDYVMCTHLHADHVGWNTMLKDGRWVPTFPRAKYIFSKNDLDSSKERSKNSQTAYIAPSFKESVLPIIEYGQAQIIENDFSLDDSLTILPTHGHTPGHYCININSGNRKGILTGDVLHSPIGILHPEWSTVFCEDKIKSNATRISLVDNLTDKDITLLPAHFGGPTVGKIISQKGNNQRMYKVIEE